MSLQYSENQGPQTHTWWEMILQQMVFGEDKWFPDVNRQHTKDEATI